MMKIKDARLKNKAELGEKHINIQAIP